MGYLGDLNGKVLVHLQGSMKRRLICTASPYSGQQHSRREIMCNDPVSSNPV